MIFKSFKKFYSDLRQDPAEYISDFMDKYYNKMVDDLNVGLKNLFFTENFRCYEAKDVSIPATTEVAIIHDIRSIPTYRLIVRQSGAAIITDGATSWTSSQIYLKNNSAVNAIVTVLIFK